MRAIVNQVSLDDTRCVCCGSPALTFGRSSSAKAELKPGDVECADCGASFDTIWGSVFLGGFSTVEFVGLLEIISTAQHYPTPIDADIPRRIWSVVEGYHQASDRDRYLAEHPDPFAQADWIENRYHEWLEANLLFAHVDMRGRKVLDVGAGQGTDAISLVDRGAQVTALDYSPQNIRWGSQAVPEARWIGGLSNALPFQNGTFDYVIANAALHHVKDIQGSIVEMLRVVKPGGAVFTTADPFRPSGTSEDVEFDVFNRHPAVLGGVNETIPMFSTFVDALAPYRDKLDLKILATIWGDEDFEGAEPANAEENARTWIPATPANLEKLGRHSGTLAMGIRLLEEIEIEPAICRDISLPAWQVASWLAEERSAMRKLLPWVPAAYLDRPFPGDSQSRIELLNGWMKPEPFMPHRTAAARGRWFLTRPPDACLLSFEWRPLGSNERALSIALNGEIVACSKGGTNRRWTRVEADIRGIERGAAFVLELALAARNGISDFDETLFDVRNRAFSA